MSLKKLVFPLCMLVLLWLPMACTEDPTDIGVDLQDPFTLFDGTRDTVFVTAGTIYDDSLWTAGYEYGIFGDYQDPLFGSTQAVVYSQIAVAGANGISLTDEVTIDSVVMTLVVDTLYPAVPDSTPVPLHITIRQLAEPLLDTSYHVNLSTQSLPESDVCFFDDDVTFYADSLNLPYGNCYLNITYDEFESFRQGRRFELQVHEFRLTKIVPSYVEVNSSLPKYAPLLLTVSSTSHLELAVAYGNASDLFNLQTNETFVLRFL